MPFSWIKGNNSSKIATIYQNNITFNTHCFENFNDVNWCLIGLDRENKKVAIKIVTNEEIDIKKYIPEILNKITFGKTYIRISNKQIVTEIRKMLDKEESNSKIKCFANFDDKNKQFILQLDNIIN